MPNKAGTLIYFDSAGSYPILPEALDAITSALQDYPGNPSATHLAGESAAEHCESVRENLAEAIGANPSEVVFTSGATESNNLALKGHFSRPESRSKRHLVVSALEHKCILAIADYLERCEGVDVSLVMPDQHGVITSEAVAKHLRPDTSLVSIMHVNNELGTVNPLANIGDLCWEKEIAFHTDAAQSFLKVPVDVEEHGLTYASFSAHKVGGPKGIGALFIRDQRSAEIEAVVHGAGQEFGLRGGTVAMPLVKSFGAAIESFPTVFEATCQKDLKNRLFVELREQGVEFSVNAESIPSLVSLELPHVNIAGLLRESDFALATGSACSAKEITASHVLSALGFSRERADKTLRISFDHHTTNQDIEQLASAIARHQSG